MNIMITGGTGYVGQRLVSKLLSQGHTIHLLCRKKPEDDFFQNVNLKFFIGDLQSRDVLKQAMHGCEQVYHVAAYARAWARDPKTYFKINVEGTVNVLDAALETGVKRLVFTSTGATFGASNGKPISEDMIRMHDFFTEYESSKFMAEEKLQHYVRRGLHACMVHPLRVYGPGVWTESNVISMMIKSYVEGDWHIIPGNGKTLGSFSFIDDLVDGHMLAMEKGRAGEKYILGGPNLNFNEFFSLLKKITSKNYLLVKIPVPLLMLFGWKEEMLSKFGKEPLITRKWIKKYHHNLDCSSEKAERELGYRITPIEVGIQKTLTWLEESKKVYL
jgi:nucleoside-diphosphate-sugar epimerase